MADSQEQTLRKTAGHFRDVKVWQKAHRWVLDVYGYTKSLPGHERFGLTSQLRRAAVSIPANFAEGFRKQTKPDKLRFYNIAEGSISECEYYLILASDLGYGETADLLAKLTEIDVMLAAYIRTIRASMAQSVS